MEVTRTDDHVTTASISAAQAIDFGISDSPEFFQILSSTLYSDQLLAVVRETLCNGWDAHLEFGCSDKAIAITLTEDYLIIRDFGPGIAPEMIGPIYGVYGGSTKAKNGAVTGGFGLGCKAPFAYVDDFEVTSYHKNLMTIYRMTKSNAEVGGKPSIVPMVSNIPTQESGIQVKIAVKNSRDRNRLNTLIQRIIQNGGMLCDFRLAEDHKFERLETLPFDDMHDGYMITNRKLLENDKPIVVRYGDVIYPIEPEETYTAEYRELQDFLTRLSGSSGRYYNADHGWKLVLQAAPNTVSVTPSRETLSNQKHTLEAIRSLMQSFISAKNKKLEAECFNLLRENTKNVFNTGVPYQLLENVGSSMPAMRRMERRDVADINHFTNRAGYRASSHGLAGDCMTEFKDFVRTWATASYPTFDGFKKRDLQTRLNSLIGYRYGGDTGVRLLKSFRKALTKQTAKPERKRKSSGWYGTVIPSPWFHQDVLWPVLKGFNEDNGLDSSKLYVFDTEHRDANKGRGSAVIPHKSYFSEGHQPSLYELIAFTRPIIIISFNKVDVHDGEAGKDRGLRLWYGSASKTLVYVTPRNPSKVEAAREYFKELGYHVIDLTADQHAAYIAKREETARNPKAKKPKIIGIPKLSACINGKGEYSNQWDAQEVDRTQNPEFIIVEGRKNAYNYVDGGYSSPEISKLLVELYGERGGVVSNHNQARRYIDNGAIGDWQSFVWAQLKETFTNNANIREYIPYWHAYMESFDEELSYRNPWRKYAEVFQCIHHDSDLCDYFGLVDNRTQEEKNTMRLFELLWEQHRYGSTGKEVMAIIKTIPLSDEIKHLYETVNKSKMLSLLNMHALKAAFFKESDEIWDDEKCEYVTADSEVTTKQYETLRDTLLTFIEG